jgi:DNA-binding MarR family transcriptional regulator
MGEKISQQDAVAMLTSVGSVIRSIKHLYAEHEGIDHGSAIVLSMLYRLGPQRPSDLAQACGLDLSTVSRYARTQEEAGHLAKVADPADRRAHRLALTDAGIEHVDGLWRARIENFRDLIGHWSPQDAHTLVELACRLAGDLGQERPIEMPELEQVRAVHKAALAETLPKGA